MTNPTDRPAGSARYAHITGWGHYAPAQVLTNADLEKMVDTSDEWIRTRTGIRERRVAAANQTTASMGAVAALRAIHTARIQPEFVNGAVSIALGAFGWIITMRTSDRHTPRVVTLVVPPRTIP